MLLTITPLGNAKNKKPKTGPPDPTDQIEVVGHIPVTNGPVRRFLATQHYSSYYLYAEHEGGAQVTLIDVTKTDHPAVLADVAYMPSKARGSVAVVAGTAALVSSDASSSTALPPQTFRIMDFSDPKNPKLAREFAGVTAISRDDKRGLIFLANPEGIWILAQNLAEDPEVKRAYEYYVIYGSSMYPPPK